MSGEASADKSGPESDLLRSRCELERYAHDMEARIMARTGELKEAQDQVAKLKGPAAIGGMMSVIAHELLVPVRAMRASIERIGHSSQVPEVMSEAVELENHRERVEQILSDLLAFIKVAVARSDRVSVHGLLDSLLAEIPSSITVQKEFAAVEVVVVGDEARLRDAVSRVVTNAIEAMLEGGTLTVRTAVDTLKVHIRISDTGPGIPPDLREKACASFFMTKPHGMGLGLAIARKVVEAHGGAVDVESEVGKGTSLILSLPLSLNSEQSPAP
ncbi:sensor histidine kinase [Elusimicrobiota bacterium]